MNPVVRRNVERGGDAHHVAHHLRLRVHVAIVDAKGEGREERARHGEECIRCRRGYMFRRRRRARAEVLVVLEAMKMEHAIKAPVDGTVLAVHYGVGDQVDEGVDLIDFEGI